MGNDINLTNRTTFFDNLGSVGFVTVKEVAAMLRVSPRTIRDWVYRGTIPFRKINGALRFNLAELENWLGEQKYDDHKNRKPN